MKVFHFSRKQYLGLIMYIKHNKFIHGKIKRIIVKKNEKKVKKFRTLIIIKYA